MSRVIGAVADDYTGAVDLATTLVARGYRTRLFFGVPEPTEAGDADALVIGLKTRSAPVVEAVRESRAALDALRRLGATRFYDKYCATFDSTPEGNIGPVLDAFMDDLCVDRSVVVLPFPEAGRTMYEGHLFVHGVPLDETSMRDHPLTPMTDSRIARLLAPQSRRAVHELRIGDVEAGAPRIAERLDALGSGIAVVDAIHRSDLDRLAAALDGYALVSGGAGFAASLPRARGESVPHLEPLSGHSLVLAGSASLETQRQLAVARAVLPSRKLDFGALRADFDAAVGALADWAQTEWGRIEQPVVVYATGDPSDVEHDAPSSAEPASALTERALAALAVRLVAEGARRIVVAGGETSGSVTKALGIAAFEVAEPLSPGIAWARGTTPDGVALDLLLKSGSLGAEDLLLTAWEARPHASPAPSPR